jgi:hypothetical protein
MPFSSFNYKNLVVEFRDPRISEMISALNALVEGNGQMRLPDWLHLALHDWKTECELPPGCSSIKLDSWISSKERFSEFIDLLKAFAEYLKPTNSLLAEKFSALQNHLLDAELNNDSKPVLVYG